MAFLEAAAAARPILRALAPLAGSAALVAAGFAAGEVYEHKVPWGLAHKRAAAVAEVAAQKRTAEDQARIAAGWKAARDASETLRRQEAAQAVQAVSAQAQACDVRVAQARASAAAIQTLISKEPRRDPNGCPVRQLVDPRELRDAIHAPG